MVPIVIDDVFEDPGAIVDAVLARGPYWNQGRYLPTGSASAVTAPVGHPLARADGSAPPVFRGEWAYGKPLVDGAEAILAHAPFVDAALQLFDGVIAVPYAVHVNLTAPGPAIDAGHTDVPAFRGLDRRRAPGWLLLAMARSGAFGQWRLRTATAVAWLYRGEGGEFTYWLGGRDGPPTSQRDLWNTALVGDNDRMFHRVEGVGAPDEPELRLSPASQLRRNGARSFDLVDDDSVLRSFEVSDLRISLSWKAAVFTSREEHDRFVDHRDDLDLASAHRRLASAVLERGVDLSPEVSVDDPAFAAAVMAAFPRAVPARAS